jgi:hypothetical protein
LNLNYDYLYFQRYCHHYHSDGFCLLIHRLHFQNFHRHGDFFHSDFRRNYFCFLHHYPHDSDGNEDGISSVEDKQNKGNDKIDDTSNANSEESMAIINESSTNSKSHSATETDESGESSGISTNTENSKSDETLLY